MPPLASEFQPAAANYASALGRLTIAVQQLATANDSTSELLYKAVAKAQAAVEEAQLTLAALFGTAAGSTLAGFLEGVGKAAVSTQRTLDEANLDSATQALNQGLAPSGVFRLPRLQGEVKFGFSSITDQKVGLIFYSRGSSQETRNEQTLNFEIVSTPAPPELLQSAARRQALTIVPELSAAKRAKILGVFRAPETKVLGDTRNPTPGKPYREHLDIPAADLDRLVIISAQDSEDANSDRYLVFFAQDSTSGNGDAVGIWRVDVASHILNIVWTIASEGLAIEKVDLLRRWVRTLGNRQAELLQKPV